MFGLPLKNMDHGHVGTRIREEAKLPVAHLRHMYANPPLVAAQKNAFEKGEV